MFQCCSPTIQWFNNTLQERNRCLLTMHSTVSFLFWADASARLDPVSPARAKQSFLAPKSPLTISMPVPMRPFTCEHHIVPWSRSCSFSMNYTQRDSNNPAEANMQPAHAGTVRIVLLVLRPWLSSLSSPHLVARYCNLNFLLYLCATPINNQLGVAHMVKNTDLSWLKPYFEN